MVCYVTCHRCGCKVGTDDVHFQNRMSIAPGGGITLRPGGEILFHGGQATAQIECPSCGTIDTYTFNEVKR